MVLSWTMLCTRESERRASNREGGCGRTAGRPGKRSQHDMEVFQAEISRAESDDRILKEKRIERHDGSGDRQKCRPPFCVGLPDCVS